MTIIERPVASRLIPELTPAQELALLARALVREGYDDHNNGHITYRQADDTFLTLPHELGWDEVTASDIVRIDHDGNLLEGRWTVTEPILLHLEFHRSRPGTDVTVHQHPRYATVWSCAGRVPPAYDQRSAAMPESEIVLYDDYEGGVNVLSAARAAVEAMGDAACALLRNHGVFVVGSSIAQAFSHCTTLEWRCQRAWFAEAIGMTRTMPAKGQASLDGFHRRVGGVLPHLWEWAVRRELRLDPAVLG